MNTDTSIPMSAETAQELVRRSLALWGMSDSNFTMMRHNENLACQVEDGSEGRYLLRICQPRTTALAGEQQGVAAIESEIAWLSAVRKDTGLLLQEPVASIRGRYIESVDHPDGKRSIPVLLLTWIDGEMLTQKEPEAEQLLAEVGRVQRRVHEQARSWIIPKGFRRPLYDESALHPPSLTRSAPTSS